MRAGRDPNQGAKDYLERIAKYVPAEILAAYLTLLPVISATTEGQAGVRIALQLITFLACLGLTPLYFRFMAQPGEPKRLHMAVSTLAFLVWAYYQGGIFETWGLYHAGAAAVLLVMYSLVSGLVAPSQGSK